MKQIYNARKRRQLRYLVKRLNCLLKDTQNGTQNKIDTLILKIKARVKELSSILAPFHLKKIIGPVALILGMSFSAPIVAQSFAAPQENPFGLVSVSNELSPPAFVDFDNDGDMDLLLGVYSQSPFPPEFHYFENTGSATNPVFAAPQVNPFGLMMEIYTLRAPTVADLDGDGDFDVMVSALTSMDVTIFNYFENTGSASVPEFSAPVTNPFGLSIVNDDYVVPSFVDLDADGDTDLLTVDYYGDILFFENTGSMTDPQFAAPVQNPFGLGTTDYYVFPAFADLDVDGDLDLLGGEQYANFQYFENTGSATEPQFAAPMENPFGLVATNYYAVPAFADLDGDGDMDLLVAEDYGVLQYFENTTPVAVDEQYVNIPLDLYPNPVNDVLTITSQTPFEKIEAYDALGKLMHTYDGSTNTIDVSDWSSGMYMLKLMDGQGLFTTRKVIKE